MLIATYIVYKNLLMKPERLHMIILDAVYGSSTLSSILSTLVIIHMIFLFRWATVKLRGYPAFKPT